MKLERLNVVELNAQEMVETTGGGFFGRAWTWIKEHVFLSVGIAQDQDGNGYLTGGATAEF